jgi:hypothetical protein
MILLFTDFGTEGPYVGQMRAVLAAEAPGCPAIDLMHDAPTFDPRASAYLLAALAERAPAGSVFLCVVDPGVGTMRAPLVVQAGRCSFVGPDNGLLALVARRAPPAAAWEIAWRPERLSASFHGRDLFAPIAAMLARGKVPEVRPRALDGLVGADWPEALAEVIYLDGYGNAMTGLPAQRLGPEAVLTVGGRRLAHAETFGAVPTGTAFWYENSSGLAEIAVNRGSAAAELGLAVGSAVQVAATGKVKA